MSVHLLHLIATPKRDASRTLKVSNAFLDHFLAAHPKAAIDTLSLFEEKLPGLNEERVTGKAVLMGGKELSGSIQQSWEPIETHIRRFLAADFYLISTPMWNFSIPYALKHYLDVIVQPKYLFRYTPQGPEGLVKSKRMFVITSRGGSYETGTPSGAYDFQEPYLKTLFNFIGITDITFLHAQPMDAGGEKVRQEKIEAAISQVKTFKF